MDLPIKFPDPHEEARRRAAEFQRLSPDERVCRMLDTIESGLALIRTSRHREAVERVHNERRQEWRAIQRELFRRYGH